MHTAAEAGCAAVTPIAGGLKHDATLARFQHPLTYIIADMVARGLIIDVTGVALALAGVRIEEARGWDAYRVVAADLLVVLTKQGALVQHERWLNPRRPENGGPWFSHTPNLLLIK